MPPGWTRTDNPTDVILAEYRRSYGEGVTKDDVFHYVYGLLHLPDYRSTYAADLKKMLPRIPRVALQAHFCVLVEAGRRLERSPLPLPSSSDPTGMWRG